MSDEEIDSEEEAPYDEESEDEGLVEMSEEDSEEPAEEEADPDAEEDESEGSDDAVNDVSEELRTGTILHVNQSLHSYPPSRSTSPTQLRRSLFQTPSTAKSYTIEPIIALPHPDATHTLAASACLSHFLTGSEDGFIRDYDIFTSANGKNLLTAQQRSYSGLADANLKAGVLRSWWENNTPIANGGNLAPGPPTSRSPVYSMTVQADALWGLSGTKEGPINLFTIRHDPGMIHHVLPGHSNAVSSMCLTHDEAGLLSAGWDGFGIQWDLNTGQVARRFPSHGAQLTTIAVRPLGAPVPANFNPYAGGKLAITTEGIHVDLHRNTATASRGKSATDMNAPRNAKPNGVTSSEMSDDAEGDTDNDYDPLFDEEGDGEGPAPAQQQAQSGPQSNGTQQTGPQSNIAAPLQMPGASTATFHPTPYSSTAKNHTPILDPVSYREFSADIFMTSGIDGQITLWDRRASSRGVGRLELPEKIAPWCMSACWSADGAHIMAGRRNGSIDVWDMRKYGLGSGQGQPKPFKTLRNPASSGSVVCVAAFPDRQHLVCASQDNLRLWNIGMDEPDNNMSKSRPSQSAPFKIIAGHHGLISQILVDPSSKFMITASGNRGWWGDSTRVVIIHSITPHY